MTSAGRWAGWRRNGESRRSVGKRWRHDPVPGLEVTIPKPGSSGGETVTLRVAHLTTVDLSLRFLVRPQLLAVLQAGGEAVGVSAPGPWVAELEEDGIRHIALASSTRGISPMSDLRAAYQLWRVLRSEHFTILHTHNPKPGLYGRILGRLTGVPLVVNTVHGLYATEDDRLVKRLVVYLLEALAARFSDVELMQNPEDLEFCRRYRILPKGRGSLLGNGVDLERFDSSKIEPGTRFRIRTDLGADDQQIVVGMVGRLVAEKGYPEFFEAAANLDDRYVFVTIGPNDSEKPDALPPEMIARAEQNGVRFLGMRTDLEDLYAAMDLFVLPSHREGFPRTAMEAAAMGLPVVATDIRGCRQVVEHEVNGLLVPVRRPDALAEAIRRLGEEPELRGSMGEASRRISRERFDEKQVVRVVMEAYQEGLRAKGLGHLLPAGLIGDSQPPSVRRAAPEDAPALAHMHSSQIGGGFLPRLGLPFMRVLYRALIGWQGAVVLVAEDAGGPVGYTVGVLDVGAFYRHFARCHWWRAGLVSLPRLIRPNNLRRAWETFRYGHDEVEVPAELLAMVVAPRARRRGLAVQLGEKLIDALGERGVEAIKVVVGADNVGALGAYRNMGFVDAGRIEVHAGETSEVLVWRA